VAFVLRCSDGEGRILANLSLNFGRDIGT
jgi:hypothetical protein